jgi:hypothetical protein
MEKVEEIEASSEVFSNEENVVDKNDELQENGDIYVRHMDSQFRKSEMIDYMDEEEIMGNKEI